MSSSSQSPPGTNNTVQPYRMHVSQKYLDLTRQKLELTRLPRDPRNVQRGYDFGISKDDLEPLVDHWLEKYDWRLRESLYNDALPQFRVPINGTRLHFVHKRSPSATAIPLLFIHGWPESFIAVSKMVDHLSNPVTTPPKGDERTQSFHVVVPSIPGFGFSDPVPEAANNIQATAEVFDALMKGLGYSRYFIHGSGWGFKIGRMLTLIHPESCLAIHTVNPEVPAPRFGTHFFTWLKYHMAKLTFAIFRRSTFGYSPEDVAGLSSPMADFTMQTPGMTTPGLTPPLTPGGSNIVVDRPQTSAYALCDSPSGLLAYIIDAIRPPPIVSPTQSPSNLRLPTSAPSPISPQSYGMSPQSSRSSQDQSPGSSHSLELGEATSPWNPTALIDWTMLYWLPGPEVALRWVVNSTAILPTLWTSASPVPLGISYFREAIPGVGSVQTPPQWSEAYYRIAMLRRRDGRVRYPAWERPGDLVLDIREFADLLNGPVPVPVVTNGF